MKLKAAALLLTIGVLAGSQAFAGSDYPPHETTTTTDPPLPPPSTVQPPPSGTLVATR